MSNLVKVYLPSFLRPKAVDTLVRIGRDFDGGYLIDERAFAETKVLLSMGISDDWSFEEQFLERKNVPLFAFDPTVGNLRNFRRMISGAISTEKGKYARRKKTFFGFRKFFTGSKRHIRKYVGASQYRSSISVAEIMDGLLRNYNDGIFVKIDIEGSEYNILSELCKYSSRFSGLVIEIHDFPKHIAEIDSFVKSIGLEICHIHYNNFGGINEFAQPIVLELTFTPFDTGNSSENRYPLENDRRNGLGIFDAELDFKSL